MRHTETKTLTFYYRGDIERGTGNGYAWRRGYSINSDDGLVIYPWNTKQECQAEAKRKGAKAVFVEGANIHTR
jgi:hypothetical protein